MAARWSIAAIGALILAAPLAGCHSTSTSPAPSTTSAVRSDCPPSAGPVDRCDAHAVAVAALTALFSYQPGIDASRADAAVRARPFLTDELGASLSTVPTGGASGGAPDADWSRWRAEKVTIRASVIATAETGHVKFVVTQRAIPTPPNMAPSTEVAVRVCTVQTVFKPGNGYKVNKIEVLS